MNNLNNKELKEDMLGPMDSPSAQSTNVEGPGQIHQTPGSMPTDMDLFSLTGPGKTKGDEGSKRNKKKEEATFPSNKVLSFGDFVKKRSTK